MTPKLAKLIAYCRANGIKGSYSVREDPPLWRARIKVGAVIYNVPADTEDEALERGAQLALDRLLDPPPQIGTPEYVAWRGRRG